MLQNVYDFIKAEEVNYTKPIKLIDGWDWGMQAHLRLSFLYKNSQFDQNNEDRYLRPNKNVILAIRNLQNRSEDYDVKDIELYVDDSDRYYFSFLVKKFHQKWALDNKIDEFIDEKIETNGDYGGVLVRNSGGVKPEVIDLLSLAFCSQKNILANPFCIKHTFSPSQLRQAAEDYGWGDNSKGATIDIEGLIVLTKDEKEIEIYELHGVLPSEWLNESGEGEIKDTQQIQVVGYYQDENKQSRGVCLFKKREPKLPFKFKTTDEIAGRALGRGRIEELFEPQVWTNWNEIKIAEMLNGAAQQINLTDDPGVAAKHPRGLKNLSNHELVEVREGKKGIWQADMSPRNLTVFNDAMDRWEQQAQRLGSAADPSLGETPASGTPFKLYEAQIIENKSMHKFRQGKLAEFMDEIYRDWVLPHFAREIANEQKFLAELSVDELQEVSEAVVKNQVNKIVKNTILSGQIMDTGAIEELKVKTKEEFLKGGTKKFIKILKDELKDIPLVVHTSIAGKQKNLALLTDKVVNVLRQYIAAPQIRQDPEMTKLLNVILESSGLSPIMFGASPMPVQAMGGVEPMKQLSQMQAQGQKQMAMA